MRCNDKSLFPAPGNPAVPVTRRQALQGGAAFVLGLTLPLGSRMAQAQSGAATAFVPGGGEAFAPNAFIRIAADDTVTVIIKHLEMGQGPYTGLATLVAEELDADWTQMRAESAPADVSLYANSLLGVQGTGGSTAMASSYQQMRTAGAAARSMLVAAAAERWAVNAADIQIEDGRVLHANGHEAGFGELAAAAADQAVPTEPSLKDPSQFRLIGKSLAKLDTRAKTRGRAEYSLDVYRHGMEVAVVAHPPKIGATVATLDEDAARNVTGVLDVQQIPGGVAVYARNTWAALKGREALRIDWDDSTAETRSTKEMLETWKAATAERGTGIETRGDIDSAPAAGAKMLEAVFEFPFLAHAPMEPLDGVIEVRRDGTARIWMGSQIPTLDHGTLAAVLGIPQEKVTINTLFAGGSFGRRAQPTADFAAELAHVAKARGNGAPIKLMWSREDDVRGGRYRPLTVHRLSGAVDAQGNITQWEDRIATPSILRGSPMEHIMKDGIDPTSHEGAYGLPYALPNLHVSLATMDTPVPVLWWRSVGHTHTAFATEVFLDELLELGGKDPFDGRLALLDPGSRDAAVLHRVRDMVDAADELPDGRARGIALHKSFGTYVAQVVEASVGDDGLPRVHRVWCAVDCGVAVNPNVITAQIEGGVGFGLGAVLFNEITLADGGTIEQSNFHDYRSLRINEMPQVMVEIVASGEAPSGIGEPGVPPVGPALANAWRRLTGSPVRKLPFAGAPA